MTYFIDGIQFSDLQMVIKIYKEKELSKEEVLHYFSYFSKDRSDPF